MNIKYFLLGFGGRNTQSNNLRLDPEVTRNSKSLMLILPDFILSFSVSTWEKKNTQLMRVCQDDCISKSTLMKSELENLLTGKVFLKVASLN